MILIMEPYWVQRRPDHPDPGFTASVLSQYIRDCMDNGGGYNKHGILPRWDCRGKVRGRDQQVRKMVRGS